MNDIYALLKCFGERYINCDDDQAQLDAVCGREDMASAFNAILTFVKMVCDEENQKIY